ncbi:hypothetical protein BOX37_26050 [Nocardia mangyaensis]|uniref:Uncharacterized protein n=1 Tax=Nocardia mangyaensis TaxID=2213200 RepID=A0A1J0VXS9_9NOCA|nr:hypothetical protein [Nocardia mangyaensis]APE36821.1 hypothetical protein BOX37_26050 [Nocardia mangyaensis]
MIDQPPHPRALGIARALAVLTLLAGIVAMHSAVFAPVSAHAAHASETGSTAHPLPEPPITRVPEGQLAAHSAEPRPAAHVAEIQTAARPSNEQPVTHTAGGHSLGAEEVVVTRESGDAHAAGTGCGAPSCSEHTAVHACVFILAALAIALSLVRLYRLGDGSAEARSVSTISRGRRRRPPPWTVLTLSQLAILRI